MNNLKLHGCAPGHVIGIMQPPLARLPCWPCGLSQHLQSFSAAHKQLAHLAAAWPATAAASASTSGDWSAPISGQGLPRHASFLGRVRAGMAQHGPSFFFTYITVSNLASCAMLATGMVLFVRATGRSPLGNGQWPNFVAFYAGVWGINQASRSARFAAAAVLTPAVDRPVAWLAERLQCDKPRAVLLLFMLEAPLLLAGLAGVLATCCGGLGRIFM